jgi:hypothetical protein
MKHVRLPASAAGGTRTARHIYVGQLRACRPGPGNRLVQRQPPALEATTQSTGWRAAERSRCGIEIPSAASRAAVCFRVRARGQPVLAGP